MGAAATVRRLCFHFLSHRLIHCVDVCIRVAAMQECQNFCGQSYILQSSDSDAAVAATSPGNGLEDASTAPRGTSPSCQIVELGEESPEDCQEGCCPRDCRDEGKDPASRRAGLSKQPPPSGCNSTCCARDLGKINDGLAARRPHSTREDACSMGNEQPIEIGSSRFSEQEKNKCCGSPNKSPGPACASHLEAAFQKYASYVKLGRCICRSVLAPIETCCSQERRARAMDPGMTIKRDSKSSITPSQKQVDGSYIGKATEADRALPADKIDTSATRPSRRDRKTKLDDIELGCLNEVTLVSFSISGMTCTGCSKKGMAVLDRIPGVADGRINFVASTGEFKLDPQTNAAKVISQFERETGFKCCRIMKMFQTLDVIMSKSEANQFGSNLPSGIESIIRVGKNIHGVSFDPTVIGARSLLALVPSGTLAAPRNDSTLVSSKKRLVRMAWSTASAAAFTIPVVTLAWSHTSIPYVKRSIVSLVLATCVQAIAIPEFYVGATKSLIFSKVIEMDMLVAISVTAAYGYSVIAFALSRRGYVLVQEAFFETSTLLVTLVLLGRLISVLARLKAFAAVSMKSLQADVALLMDGCEETVEIDARLLEYGDTVIIPPHGKVVTDGEVTSGAGAVDESMVTGESGPVQKKCGDTMIAGTMNGSSPLNVRLTRLPGQNSISDIAELVQNALGTKPRVQDLADKIAGWFVPVVVGISCVVFAIWLGVGFKIRNQDAGGSIGVAITYGIAVLAISCPCALGLAVPMVLIIAGGVAAKFGIIIKNASATERAYRTTDVVFDKTGTLTTGVLELGLEEYYGAAIEPAKLKGVVLALVKNNRHPVSSAVAQALRNQQVTASLLEDVQSIPGAGLEAVWNGSGIRAGNPDWLAVQNRPEIRGVLDRGLTILGVTVNSELVATYGLTSTLRPEAKATIRALQRRRVVCHIVSGDTTKAVEDVAWTLEISSNNVASRQNPSTKQAYVKNLIDQGRTVIFCGDGTNDAVAVAQAHVGIQIGSTSDITRATADVVLTGGLNGILSLLDISKQAYVRIGFNFVWSAIYNLFAILLAAGAFVKVRIPPAYAGLGEIVSVLPVILVAMSLIWIKQKPWISGP